MKKLFATPFAIFCFVINPLWIMSGCEDTLSEEEEVTYTREDMIKVLKEVPLTYAHVTDDGETIQLTLHLDEIDEQALATNLTQAPQPSSPQDLISAASACIITNQAQIAFTGTLSITSSLEGEEPTLVAQDVPIHHGNFTVLGTTLDNFQIHVTANTTQEDNDQKTYSAWISSRDGLAKNARLHSVHY